MNNTLHTPGPWRVVRSSAHNNHKTTRKDILGESQFGPAYVAGDISEIDARLISAAPNLLAICEEIANDSKCDLVFSDRRIRLYSAIAKAKGEA